MNKEFWLVPAVATTLPEPAVNALRKARGVRVVEPDGSFHAIDHTGKEGENPELDYAWGVKHIGTGPVHNTNRTGRSKADVREDGNEDVPVKGVPVRVAIIDSGISPHQDLATIAGGWNFINNSDNFHDDTNHRTHVAGTVAAIYNGYGVVGVAPEVDLYAVKTLGPNGGSFSSVIAALQWCLEKGIQVTNNSYGSSGDPGTIVQDAFDNSSALAIVHVAAAGNSGRVSGNNNSVQWPARYASVIAVAATNANGQRASWSSTVPTVEISAPGVNIWSTWAGDVTDPYESGTSVQYSRTSMASPHVAGVATLLIAEGISDPRMVRGYLAATAKPLGSANHFGAGLVQADAAVFAAADDNSDGDGTPDPGDDTTDPGDDTTGPEEPVTPFMSGMVSYAGTGPRGRHLVVTLRISDDVDQRVAGATVSATLHNDLGQSWSYNGTTNSVGTIDFQRSNAPSGKYWLQIHAVVHPIYEWSGYSDPGHSR